MTAKVLEFERQGWQARWKKSHSGNDPMNEIFASRPRDSVTAPNAALLPNNQGDQTRLDGAASFSVYFLSASEWKSKQFNINCVN